MAELLLELYSEEIPPQLQIAARSQIKIFIHVFSNNMALPDDINLSPVPEESSSPPFSSSPCTAGAEMPTVFRLFQKVDSLLFPEAPHLPQGSPIRMWGAPCDRFVRDRFVEIIDSVKSWNTIDLIPICIPQPKDPVLIQHLEQQLQKQQKSRCPFGSKLNGPHLDVCLESFLHAKSNPRIPRPAWRRKSMRQ